VIAPTRSGLTLRLVLNNTERHQPVVRLAADRIAALLREHRALFRGDRPQG
jgi:hypothetical protein